MNAPRPHQGAPPPRRAFFQWRGGSPEDRQALARLSQVGPDGLGAPIAEFRGGLTARAVLQVAIAMALLLVVLTVVGLVISLWSPPEHPLNMIIGFPVAVALIGAILLGVGQLDGRANRAVVHQHGLVLHQWGSASHPVPWEGLDPGRTFIGLSARAITRVPAALHRRRANVAPFVTLSGWAQSPQGKHLAVESFVDGLRWSPSPSDSPFGWWQVAVRDLDGLLEAMEWAMVQDGYPAHGFADYARSRRYTGGQLRRHPEVQRERTLADPLTGLPSWSPPHPPA